MDNVFDQFDELPAPAKPARAAANPFDVFDGDELAAAVPDFSNVVSNVGSTEAAPVGPAPERTWGETVDDAGLMVRRGTRNVVGGLAGAPVNLTNLVADPIPARVARSLVNALGMGKAEAPIAPLGQPEVVRGIRESLVRENQADTVGTQSPLLAEQAQRFEDADGFLTSLGYLVENPSYLGMLGAEQVPQLATAVPGKLLATIGLQGVSAGSQNEQQVAQALVEAVAAGEMTQAEADAVASNVFAASAGLNTALPFVPGAGVLERLAANVPSRVAGQGVVGAAARGALGESVQGVTSEGGDQVIANLGTGAPVLDDVGKAAAMGLLIEGPLGGLGGAAEGLSAPAAPGAAPAPVPAPVTDMATALGDLIAPAPPAAVPGGETPQASGPAAAPADTDLAAGLDALLADPNIAAALAGIGEAAPTEASAKAAPAVAGGSPAPVGADSPQRAAPEAIDQALAMDEDAYIAAVNPTGKRSSAEDEIAFAAGDIDTPTDAAPAADLSFTDKQGRAVQVFEGPQGLYAQVDGKTVGLIESSDGETLNQVAKEYQGAGIGAGLARAQLLRDPMTPAGSFSDAGEATRRAALRQLRADRSQALGDAVPAKADRSLGFLRDEIGWAERGGQLLRERNEWDGDETNFQQRNTGDVIGRTAWSPKMDPGGRPSSFWRNRPGKLTEAEANTALDRYERGEKLTKRQQAFIDHARETAAGYDKDSAAEAAMINEYAADEQAAAIAAMRAAKVDVADQDQGEALALYELTARAIAAGADDIDVAPFADEPARAHAARLWSIIRGSQDADTRPAPVDRRPGQEDRQDAPAPAAAPRQAAGLFPAATAREAVDAAQRDRDAQRDGRTGTGRTDMAAGAGELFAGPRPDQASIESRNTRDPKKPRERLKQLDGVVPQSGLKDDAAFDANVGEVERGIRNLRAIVSPAAKAIRQALGAAARHIEVYGSPADLDADVLNRIRPSARAEGVYDPQTGKAYVFADANMTPERAVWVAFHEVAGHLGLRGAALQQSKGDRKASGDRLVASLDAASSNPTVQQLAAAIRRDSPDYDQTRATEEALAEAAAAARTGDYAALSNRYGVEIPQAQRDTLRGAMARLVQSLRAFLRALVGKSSAFTDADVYQLLADAWRYAETAPVGETGRGDARSSESRRAFSDGRGQRRIEHNGEAFVKRGDDYLLAADGKPVDFFMVRDAEAEAGRVGGEVVQDAPQDGQRRTWSVRLPERVRRDAEREFMAESRRADQTETPEFRRWFGDSKVVDADGKPLRVYHGSKRPDRIGNRFRADRATSGPMAFFTDNPAIASNYASGKRDTSIEMPEDYADWFKFKAPGSRSEVNLDRAWWALTPEQRASLTETLPRVTDQTPDGDESPLRLGEPGEYGLSSRDHWAYAIKEARGNVLAAAGDLWLDGGVLYGDEARFLEVLRLAGMPEGMRLDDPNAEFPSVLPVHLAINNPFDTSNSESMVDVLQRASTRQRKAPQEGADQWDKRSVSARDWMDRLRGDLVDGTAHAWTSIPDWVTATLRAEGFDGIKDRGGRTLGGAQHDVWIPFTDRQVKSAVGNRGAFNPDKNSILESRRPRAPGDDLAPNIPADATARSVIADGRALSLIDAAKAAGADLAPLNAAYARKDGPAVVRAMDDLLAVLRTPPQRVTGTKNAVTDAEREAAGRDPILRDAVKTNEAAVYEAMRTVTSDPMAGPEAVARLSRGGVEGISLADEAVLLVHKTELVNQREAAAKKLADPNASEDAKAVARAAWESAEAQIAAVDVAAVNAGREWGRFGQFRQRMMQEDFTLAALERKERARLERPLTQEESATVRAMAEKIAGLQAQVDKLQERTKNAGSERTYEALAKAVTRPAKKRPTLEMLRTAANDARARLAKVQDVPSRRGQSGAAINPSVLYDYAVIGAFHVANGASKFSDWVSAMRADLGEAFDRLKAEHPSIFKAAKQQVDRPIAEGASVAQVMQSIDPTNITPKDVRKLVEAYVVEGLRGEPAVVSAVAKALEMDEGEVRQLFVQSEPRAAQTLTEAQAELRDLRKIVRIENEIARLEAGAAKPARGMPVVDSPAVAAKKQELATLRQAMRASARPDPETRYQELRGKAIEKRIADLQQRIADGDFEPRPRIPRALNEANQRAQFELAKAKEEFARHQFEDQLRKRSPLGKAFGAVGDVFNLARAVMTSFDLSAPLRQGGFIVLGNPLRGLKGIAPMLRSFASEQANHAAKADIEGRKNAPLYKKFGLELTGIGAGPLTQVEEAYASRWLDKLPRVIGGGLVRGSGRAYTSFLNRLRADSFDAMVASLARGQVPTEAEGKAIARYINVATGRGPIGGREKAGEVMNTVFFAPRLVASRFQLLAGMPLYAGSARTRRMIAKEYARFLTGVAVFMGLSAFMLDDAEDDDDAPAISFDPRSANFGKIKSGNTYIDPLAGLAQVTTFLGRLITGETVNASGKVSPLRQWGTLTDLRRAMGEDIPAHELNPDGMLGFGSSSAADTIGRFIRTKLAPVPGAIVNSLSGSNLLGEPVTPLDAAQEMITPMSFGDVADAMEENGVPKGTALGLLVVLGMGVQTRSEASPLTATATARTDIKERLSVLPVDQWEAEMEAMRKEYGPVMDGVSLAYYKRDGKFGDAGEPRRTADGMPVLETERLSNPSTANRNYRALLESQGKTEAQITADMARTAVHHIIPDNVVRQHPLMIQARTSLGYDLDQSSNLVGLAKEKTEATESGVELGHWTDHPFYDMAVVGELDAAQQRLRRKHGAIDQAPKQEVLDAIRKVEETMRKKINAQEVPKKDGRLAASGDSRGAERTT